MSKKERIKNTSKQKYSTDKSGMSLTSGEASSMQNNFVGNRQTRSRSRSRSPLQGDDSDYQLRFVQHSRRESVTPPKREECHQSNLKPSLRKINLTSLEEWSSSLCENASSQTILNHSFKSLPAHDQESHLQLKIKSEPENDVLLENVSKVESADSLRETELDDDFEYETQPSGRSSEISGLHTRVRRPRGDISPQSFPPQKNPRKQPTPRPYFPSTSRQPRTVPQANEETQEELSIEDQFNKIMQMQSELPPNKSKSTMEMCDYVKQIFESYNNKWSSFTKEDDQILEQTFNSLTNNQNCVKNILKSFGKYMDEYSDSLVIESIDGDKLKPEIIKKYKRFSSRCAVNNKFLQKTIKNPKHGKQFKYFLNFYSLDWLIKSRVEDKIIMLVSIFFLSRCFENSDLINNVHFYKRNFRTQNN